MRKDDAYLLDILLAARKVLKYAGNMQQKEFDSNELVQDAVIRQLEIMGEAAGRISEYFRINRQIVWDTIQNDLPDLIRLVEPLVPAE